MHQLTLSPARARPASPYARRLARERGLSLAAITGSGPGGRVVAADVEAFLPGRDSPAAAMPAAISALGAAVTLVELRQLLVELGQAGVEVTLDDVLIRAAALALEAVQPTDGGPVVVALESGGGATARLAPIADAHLGLVSRLHTRLVDAARAMDQGVPQPRLTLRRLREAGLRAMSMPLVAGAELRLVVSVGEDAAAAEALLSFDARRVGEDEAAALLARFRDGLQAPLRLLA